jgi:hypothetical protein
MIVNDQGDSVGTLEQVFQGLRGVVDDNARLRREVESLTAGVTTQGMNILDGLGFASEAQVREVVEMECPRGDAFEVFLDVVSLWCCDPGYAPATNWEKTTRAMEEDYSTTARKVVASYYQTHCWWYAEGKPAVAGTTLAAFKNTDKWEGMSGMDGRRREIETSAGISAEIGKTWVANKLPPSGKLAPLAIKMIDKTVEWISKVHKHLDAELLKLTQQHITEEDALMLSTSGTVHWEWFGHWNKAVDNFMPRYSALTGTKGRGIVRGIFPVNVPFNMPMGAIFKPLEYYRVLAKDLVLFRPREWRGSSNHSGIPFSHREYLSPSQLAAELSHLPRGTITWIYLTSDGGGNLTSVYDMVSQLDSHVSVVSHESLIDLALQRG